MKSIAILALAISVQAQAQNIAIVPQTSTFTPTTVVTSSGTYVVVPNYTTGATQAVIQTSRGTLQPQSGSTNSTSGNRR
jgi:hypothetical protein